MRPKEKRANTIKKAAKDLVRQIKDFRTDETFLTNKVAFAQLRMDQSLFDLQIIILQRATELGSVRQGSESDAAPAQEPIQQVKRFLNDAKELRYSLPIIRLQAAHVAVTCANAYRIASNLLILRHSRLQTFLKDNVDISIDTIVTALKEIVKDKSVEEIKAILEEVAKFQFEELPVIRLLGTWNRFKEKILKIQQPYRSSTTTRKFVQKQLVSLIL